MLLYKIILLITISYLALRSTAQHRAKISPDLYKNKLKFPWGINYKYNGLLHHNLDRVWIVTKVPLPRVEKIRFPKDDKFELDCTFEQSVSHKTTSTEPKVNLEWSQVEYLRALCKTAVPTMRMLQKTNDRLKETFIKLVVNDLHTALPYSSPAGRRKRFIAAIVGPVIAGLATLAVEQLNNHLQNKRLKAMKKAIDALRQDTDKTKNFVKQFKDDFLMYGEYDIDKMDEVIHAFNDLSVRNTRLENLMKGRDLNWTIYFLQSSGVPLYGQQVQLYIHQIHFGYLTLYEDMINQQRSLLRSIAQLSKGYLPQEIFTPSRLKEIETSAIQLVQKSHPEYVVALTQITHYYDMQLATFSVDKTDYSMIVTFPIFITSYSRQELTLYEIETVPVPINDLNEHANSYTEVQITKPYIAINNDYYIQLRIQELRMCKQIQYKYYCEELFLVKHKSKHSCESALYFNLPEEIIQKYCEFKYFFNKTVTPSILDGGPQIILANILNQKKLICNRNFNLAEPLPSHEYVLLNRSILCNCEIESGMTYVLRSIGACSPDQSPNPMYFTINLAFLDYFKHQLPQQFEITENMSKSLNEWKIPVYLQEPVDTEVSLRINPPTNLKELMAKIKLRDNLTIETNDYMMIPDDTPNHKKLFIFITSILTCIVLALLIYLATRHQKLKTLVGGLVLHSLPTVNSLISTKNEILVVCQEPWLSYFLAALTILGTVIYFHRIFRELSFLKGYKFDKHCCIYITISDAKYYVPLKLKPSPGHLHLFTVNKFIEIGQVTLDKGFLWDTVHINWQGIIVQFKKKIFYVPTNITVPLWHKFMIRNLLKDRLSEANLMIRQGDNWSYLSPRVQRQPPDDIPQIVEVQV
jgi:hypothetical protein